MDPTSNKDETIWIQRPIKVKLYGSNGVRSSVVNYKCVAPLVKDCSYSMVWFHFVLLIHLLSNLPQMPIELDSREADSGR